MLTNQNNKHKPFSDSLFYRVKDDSDYKIAIFTSCSIFLQWLGGNTHMHTWHLWEICICKLGHIWPVFIRILGYTGLNGSVCICILGILGKYVFAYWAHRPNILASVFFNCPEKKLVFFYSKYQYKAMAKTSRTKIRAILDF